VGLDRLVLESGSYLRRETARTNLLRGLGNVLGVIIKNALGRPSILVPLPGAIDQDQFANAGVLSQVGGALRISQPEFTPDRLAADISAFAAEPAKLTAMASAARSVGRLDAAERLADLVMKTAQI